MTLRIVCVIACAGVASGAAAQPSPRVPVVMLVGCAQPGAQPHAWELLRASEQTESSRAGLTADDRTALASRPLGANRYQLIGVAEFVDGPTSRTIGVRGALLPESRVNATGMLVNGHKVAVKGLYIDSTPPRINLTSVVDLGAGCR